MAALNPKFVQVLPADIGQYGADAACVLALVRYVTSQQGERNGRRIINGETWWFAEYEEIGAALGGMDRQKVGRAVRALEAVDALATYAPDMFRGVRTKAYRVQQHWAADQQSSKMNGADQQSSDMNDPRSNMNTPKFKNERPPFKYELSIPLTGELEKVTTERGERAAALAGDTAPPNLIIAELLHSPTPPPRFCDRHMPNGTDRGCRACGFQIQLFEDWYKANKPSSITLKAMGWERAKDNLVTNGLFGDLFTPAPESTDGGPNAATIAATGPPDPPEHDWTTWPLERGTDDHSPEPVSTVDDASPQLTGHGTLTATAYGHGAGFDAYRDQQLQALAAAYPNDFR
ncbi:hypothetical protein [Mycobacterium paragordonae]|uniref:hypothetical protein n=1 Tax=Mycobacterium paragordonae TaxID=1389713 RepID=UPI0012E0F0FF|nr:hypothetical protein [Mycobacterium paragordonae]